MGEIRNPATRGPVAPNRTPKGATGFDGLQRTITRKPKMILTFAANLR